MKGLLGGHSGINIHEDRGEWCGGVAWRVCWCVGHVCWFSLVIQLLQRRLLILLSVSWRLGVLPRPPTLLQAMRW